MRTRNHRERMMTESGLAIDARNYTGTEALQTHSSHRSTPTSPVYPR